MRATDQEQAFVICIHNAAYTAALELRKVYQVIPDAQAAQQELLRVIDESGEDYLYPKGYFIPVTFPASVQKAILQAA